MAPQCQRRSRRAIRHDATPVRLPSRLAWLGVLSLLAACSTYQNTRDTSALIQAPNVHVALDLGEAKPNQQALVHTTIKAIVLAIDDNTQLPFTQRVVLKQSNGATQHLLLSLPPDLPLPFRSGERLTVHIAQRWHKNAHQLIQAIHIQGGMKDTRFLLQQEQLLSNQHIPKEISVTAGKDVVYTESQRVDGMCFATTEHRKLVLTVDGTPAEVAPGRIINLHLQSGQYQWMAIDNRITLDSNCDNHSDDRMAWVLVRVNDS